MTGIFWLISFKICVVVLNIPLSFSYPQLILLYTWTSARILMLQREDSTRGLKWLTNLLSAFVPSSTKVSQFTLTAAYFNGYLSA